MAPHDLIGNAQHFAEFANLVLEQVAERLDERELHVFGEPADVVVEFDVRALTRVAVARLDDIGVQRALRKEVERVLHAGHGSRLDRLRGGIEHIDEPLADAFALLLGVGDALEIAEELRAGVDDRQVDVEVIAEGRLDEVALALAQEAVVNEHARQLIADGFVNERGADGGINAPRQAADDATVADLIADSLGGDLDEVLHAPSARALADLVEEILQDRDAVRRVRDFRVELHAVEREFPVAHDRVRAGGRAGEILERIVDVLHLIAVGHPDRGLLGDGVEQVALGARAGLDVEVGAAELAAVGVRDLGAHDLAGELHAVADAQDRDAEAENLGVASRRAVVVHRGGATREDDALRVERAEFRGGDRRGDQHRVRAGLADSAADELGGLAAEVENGHDLVVRERLGCRIGHWCA